MTDIDREMIAGAGPDREAETPDLTQYLLAMSHELRAPLNAVIGMSGLLLDDDLSSKQRQYARSIHTAGEGLATILNDVLDLCRVSTSRVVIEPIPFDLKSMIEETARVLTPRANERGLALRVDWRPELARHVIGDPGRTRQVLGNLVGHAVNATSQGEVVIRVMGDADQGGARSVRFVVEDTGIGIAPARLERIFHDYIPLDASPYKSFGVTGLGLRLSAELVRLMGGRIGAESVPGRGSQLWFSLPMPTAEPPARRAPAEAVAGGRVLIVEADQSSRSRFAEQVAAAGWEAAFNDDIDGLLDDLRAAAAGGHPYRVCVLSHYALRPLHLDLAARLKADPDFASLALVMVTAVGSPGEGKKLWHAGFAAYLRKPVTPDEMAETLAALAAAGSDGRGASLVTRHSLAEARNAQSFEIDGIDAMLASLTAPEQVASGTPSGNGSDAEAAQDAAPAAPERPSDPLTAWLDTIPVADPAPVEEVPPAVEPAVELAVEPAVEPAVELAVEPAVEPAVDHPGELVIARSDVSDDPDGPFVPPLFAAGIRYPEPPAPLEAAIAIAEDFAIAIDDDHADIGEDAGAEPVDFEPAVFEAPPEVDTAPIEGLHQADWSRTPEVAALDGLMVDDELPAEGHAEIEPVDLAGSAMDFAVEVTAEVSLEAVAGVESPAEIEAPSPPDDAVEPEVLPDTAELPIAVPTDDFGIGDLLMTNDADLEPVADDPSPAMDARTLLEGTASLEVISLDIADQLTHGGGFFVQHTVASCLREVPRRIGELVTAAARTDAVAMGAALDRIATAASTVGAARLEEIARRLASRVAEGDAAAATGALGELEAAFLDTRRALDAAATRGLPADTPPLGAAFVEQLSAREGPARQLALRLVDSFSAEAPARIQDIRSAVAAGSSDATQRFAQTLKGMCGLIGAEPLAKLSALVEADARLGRTTQAERYLGPITLELERVQEALTAARR